MVVKYVTFKQVKYKLVFTEHGARRMKERKISFEILKNSIENFDKYYKRDGKNVVEKLGKIGNIRTVFTIKANNIILITTMILGK